MSGVTVSTSIRPAFPGDIESVRRIYNEGIEDRIATLDSDPKTEEDIAEWWKAHDERYAAAVADLSVDISRSHRGCGIGVAMEKLLR